jgi:uncharacterized protein
MVHLKNSGYLPSDAPILLSKADKLTSGMNRIIRDMRVSSKYLEFDVSVDKEQLDILVEKLGPISPLDHARHIIEEKIEKEEAMLKAREYFNNERFWECHEVLEGVWKNVREGERDLIQGIILVAAALVHYQKNEIDICLSIFKRAMEKLSSPSTIYYNIDVDLFRKKVAEMISTKKIATFTI